MSATLKPYVSASPFSGYLRFTALVHRQFPEKLLYNQTTNEKTHNQLKKSDYAGNSYNAHLHNYVKVKYYASS